MPHGGDARESLTDTSSDNNGSPVKYCSTTPAGTITDVWAAGCGRLHVAEVVLRKSIKEECPHVTAVMTCHHLHTPTLCGASFDTPQVQQLADHVA